MKRQSVSISRYSEPGIIADLAAHLERNNVSAIEIETPDGSLKIVAMAGGQAPAAPRPAETARAPAKTGKSLPARRLPASSRQRIRNAPTVRFRQENR